MISFENSIGIFDSGIGGLTVLAEIRKALPNENLIYFGDTARVPYGTKSDKTVKLYSLQNALFLLQHKVKLIVIACNTSSAIAFSYLAEIIKVPIIGVIDPGVRGALKATQNKRIGIIGTRATISSGAYENGFKLIDDDVQSFSKACPLFVPLIEEGWMEHPSTKLIVQEYLNELIMQKIDTLVLGCTHYPLLTPVLQNVVGDQIKLVDSAIETARAVKSLLEKERLLNKGGSKSWTKTFFSDVSERSVEMVKWILGDDQFQLRKIHTEELVLS